MGVSFFSGPRGCGSGRRSAAGAPRRAWAPPRVAPGSSQLRRNPLRRRPLRVGPGAGRGSQRGERQPSCQVPKWSAPPSVTTTMSSMRTPKEP